MSGLRTKRAARVLLVLTALLMLSLAGCRLGGHGTDCQVRLIDAVPNAQGIRADVGSKDAIRIGPLGQQTGFFGVSPGRYRVYTAVERGNAPLVHLPVQEVEAHSHHRYTVLALGMAGADPPAHLAVLDDPIPTSPLPSSEARVRVAMAAPDTGEVDVLVNSIVAFKDLRFGERSEPLMLASLPYEWTIKEAGRSITALAGPTTLKLKGGRSYLIVIMGRTSDHTLVLQAFEDR